MLKLCARVPGLFVFSCLFVAGSAWTAAGPPGSQAPRSGAPRPGERWAQPGMVVVKLVEAGTSLGGAGKTGSSPVDQLLARHGSYQVEPVLPLRRAARKPSGADPTRIFIVRYGDGQAPEEVARELSGLDAVEYAEPHYAYPLAGQPNDTNISQQLSYLQHMQFIAGWDVTVGEQGPVVIAIVDGGTDWTHNDLNSNIWSNPGETAGNSIDDDGNGFVDDIRGWNFANNTNNPMGLPSTPESATHGTHTAGIAGAVTNNSLQVAGGSWNAKIMPINTALAAADRVIGYGYEGIAYAADNGANVISASWGGSGGASTFEQEIIQFAHDQGAAICAAAGNNSGNADSHYPSAYPHVLSVTNVTLSDTHVTIANFGYSVDVAAHGEAILSTIPSNFLGTLWGTSMSTPFVAAACALVKTKWPAYTADQVMQRVRVTCDNIDGVNPEFRGQLGYGRLNVLQALTKNTPAIRISDIDIVDQDGDGVVERNETVEVNLTLTNLLARAQTVDLDLSIPAPSQPVTITNSHQIVAALDSLQSLQIPPFNLQIASTAANNVTVDFELGISVGTPAYVDKDRFKLSIQPLFIDHGGNSIRTTVTSMGRLGYALNRRDGTDGVGFAFGTGPNILFEAAMMMGISSTKLVDAARGLNVNNNITYQSNFGTPVGGTPHYLPPELADEQSRAFFTDGAAPQSLRLQLSMRQDAYVFASPPDNDYIILRYRIRNDSGGTMPGLYVGWYHDWDIGDPGDPAGALGDRTAFDAGRGLGYTWDENGAASNVYVGMAVLTPPGTTSFRGIWNDQANPNNPSFGVYDGYTKSEKWQTMTEGVVHTEAGPEDVSLGFGTGPFTFDDSITVAFVYVGGSSLADLQANTDAAIAKWATLGPITPVTLYDLSAAADGGDVVVRWRTTDERDIATFRVYRSKNGGGLLALGPDVERNNERNYVFRDPAPGPGSYLYRVAEISPTGDAVLHGAVELVIEGAAPPRSYLSPGTPNPFNPNTTLRYGLTAAGPVRLEVFDARGRHVRTLVQNAYVAPGIYGTTWNGTDDDGRAVPSGSYHVRLQLVDQVFTRRVTLLK